MLEILESPKHVVAMKLSGDLTAEDVSKAYKATEDAVKENGRISFYAEKEESMSLRFEGLFKDLFEGIGQLGKLKHYYRAALVTEKGWVATIARIEGLVFSSVDVKIFKHDEKAKALAWASEASPPIPVPEPPKESIHFLKTSSDKVFAYEVNGRITQQDITAATKEMKDAFDRPDKINVLLHIKDWQGFDLSAVVDDDLAKLKYKAISKVDRYAVIGAPAWLRNLLELIDPLFSVNIKIFEPGEEDAAWEWVGARQALLAP